MKKYTILVTIMALVLSLVLASCGSQSEAVQTNEDVSTQQEASTQEGAMTEGIYESRFTSEGRGEYVNYFHFYDNDVFYYSSYNGGQVTAGFYEVIDEEIEYINGADDSVCVAPQYVLLTNFDGSEYGKVALLNDMLVGYAPLYNSDFTHIIDTDHTKEDEFGIAVVEFVSKDDSYATVKINHNGSFQDTINSMIEGTWEKAGDVYTLKVNDTNEIITLSIIENGAQAEYKTSDGTTVILQKPISEIVTQFTFKGKENEAIKAELYSNGVCAILYDGLGEVTAGEWTIDASTALPVFNITLNETFENTPIEVVADMENSQFYFVFKNTSGQLEETLVLTFEDYKATL